MTSKYKIYIFTIASSMAFFSPLHELSLSFFILSLFSSSILYLPKSYFDNISLHIKKYKKFTLQMINVTLDSRSDIFQPLESINSESNFSKSAIELGLFRNELTISKEDHHTSSMQLISWFPASEIVIPKSAIISIESIPKWQRATETKIALEITKKSTPLFIEYDSFATKIFDFSSERLVVSGDSQLISIKSENISMQPSVSHTYQTSSVLALTNLSKKFKLSTADFSDITITTHELLSMTSASIEAEPPEPEEIAPTANSEVAVIATQPDPEPLASAPASPVVPIASVAEQVVITTEPENNEPSSQSSAHHETLPVISTSTAAEPPESEEILPAATSELVNIATSPDPEPLASSEPAAVILDAEPESPVISIVVAEPIAAEPTVAQSGISVVAAEDTDVELENSASSSEPSTSSEPVATISNAEPESPESELFIERTLGRYEDCKDQIGSYHYLLAIYFDPIRNSLEELFNYNKDISFPLLIIDMSQIVYLRDDLISKKTQLEHEKIHQQSTLHITTLQKEQSTNDKYQQQLSVLASKVNHYANLYNHYKQLEENCMQDFLQLSQQKLQLTRDAQQLASVIKIHFENFKAIIQEYFDNLENHIHKDNVAINHNIIELEKQKSLRIEEEIELCDDIPKEIAILQYLKEDRVYAEEKEIYETQKTELVQIIYEKLSYIIYAISEQQQVEEIWHSYSLNLQNINLQFPKIYEAVNPDMIRTQTELLVKHLLSFKLDDKQQKILEQQELSEILSSIPVLPISFNDQLILTLTQRDKIEKSDVITQHAEHHLDSISTKTMIKKVINIKTKHHNELEETEELLDQILITEEHEKEEQKTFQQKVNNIINSTKYTENQKFEILAKLFINSQKHITAPHIINFVAKAKPAFAELEDVEKELIQLQDNLQKIDIYKTKIISKQLEAEHLANDAEASLHVIREEYNTALNLMSVWREQRKLDIEMTEREMETLDLLAEKCMSFLKNFDGVILPFGDQKLNQYLTQNRDICDRGKQMLHNESQSQNTCYSSNLIIKIDYTNSPLDQSLSDNLLGASTNLMSFSTELVGGCSIAEEISAVSFAIHACE
ncbi:MAG: hypothetical protein EOP33_03110 [Rickettsiaceae bacterium]|nr:MAG: hypothetical protein EOP33_03110 [Rickettsiaceae bacterium]